MKKIKISELPLFSSLKGLFVIGTDDSNRSVKVNLEFIKTETDTAVTNAETATASALEATTLTKEATLEAQQATTDAQTATQEAQTATEEAKTATQEATTAAQNAKTNSELANEAAALAQEATLEAQTATAAAQTATKESVQATTDAQAATVDVLAKIAVLVPSSLSVECVKRITWGNVTPIQIKAVLSPETAMQNIIYLSDNQVIEVSPKGVITAIAKGLSRVHIIPTMNTALAKTCLIEVGDPTLRLVTSSSLRFTQAGGLRLN